MLRSTVIVVVCCWVTAASAQPKEPTPREKAATLFVEGRTLMERSQTEAACVKFEQALAIDPVAVGIMLNLGLCYEKLGKFASSLKWFRKAQFTAAETRQPEYENEAKRHTIELAVRVATVKLDMTAASDNVEIRIDGTRIAPADYARVEVDRGRHTLEARAPGKQPHTQTFEVATRQAETLVIPALTTLQESAPAGPPTDAPLPGASDRSRGAGRKILAATFGGVGLGLAIVAPLWARSVKNTYDADVASGAMPSWEAARNQQHLATGMFGSGLVLIGLATYLYLTMPSDSRAIAVSPSMGNGQLGLVVNGAL